MRSFIVRILITSFGLWLADAMLQGMYFDHAAAMVVSALLFGLVNATVRPVVVLITLPITFLSLGLFLLVINGAMLLLVARLMPAFHLDGVTTAVLGSIVVGMTGWLANGRRHRQRIRH